ncbi:MAG TPA: lipoyl(octanoyl) transferase LipB [Pyrinomonadaceae bacterium]|jgi:lipoyl(octanoyl) transferase|nr:lipoyl(octanoyl) transferase LipB [Pyrinomonadaceae bacterium]
MTRHVDNQVAPVDEKRKLLIRKLGRVEYDAALGVQKETELAVKEGRQADTLLLLEHPHTLTVGRRGDSAGILMSPELLKARGVRVFETNRGGKITYHGLGQVVGYPIISLSPDREDVHRYVRDLEEVLVRTLADFEIPAFRLDGLTGVHTSRGKVAAIGVHIARWITTHGFALNVNTDLSFFNLIIACEGEQVTSMEDLLGHEVDVQQVEDRLVANFAEVFDMIREPSTGLVSNR